LTQRSARAFVSVYQNAIDQIQVIDIGGRTEMGESVQARSGCKYWNKTHSWR